MDYCFNGPSNFSVVGTPDDIISGTITFGTFNLWCGTQNATPLGPTGDRGGD